MTASLRGRPGRSRFGPFEARLAVAASLLFLGHLAGRAEAAQPRELLLNGGFEEVDATGWATHWERPAGAAVDRIAAAGNRSLRIRTDGSAEACTQRVRLVPGRRYAISLEVRTRDVGVDGDASFAIEYLDSAGRLIGGVSPSGYSSSVDWRTLAVITDPVPAGTASARIGLRATTVRGTAWFDEASVREYVPPPLDARLLYPNFRGLMGERIWEPTYIRAGCDVGLPGTKLSDLSIAAEVVDSRGQVSWLETPAPPPSRSFQKGFDLRWIPEGDYTFRLTLRSADGQQVGGTDLPFVVSHVVELSSRPVFINAAKTLLARGEPLLPVGLMDSYDASDEAAHERRLRMLRGSPFDLLINRVLSTSESKQVIRAISELASIGVRTVLPVAKYEGVAGTSAQGILPGFPGRSVDARLASCARTLRGMEGFLGWQLADATPVQYAALVTARYRRLLDLDPGHFTMSLHGGSTREEVLQQYGSGEDVACVMVAPNSSSATQPIQFESDAFLGYRPIWAVVPLSTRSGDLFSRNMLREATYGAITAGANGLLYDSLDSLLASSDPAGAWREIEALAEELRAIEPYMLRGSTLPRVSCTPDRIATHSKLIAFADRRLLIVVNPAGWSGPVTFSLDPPPISVNVLFENRRIQPGQGTFEDEFREDECHVYEID